MNRGDYGDIRAAAAHSAGDEDYWLNKLAGELEETRFPYDNKKGEPGERNPDRLKFRLPEELFPPLMKLRNGSDPRLYMILAAALVVLIHKYTGSRDIIVAAPIYKQEIEGKFVNTVLFLRNQIRENMTFKELLLQVRQTIIEADEHQNYPIEALMYRLGRPFPGQEFSLANIAILLENIHDAGYIEHITPGITFSFRLADGYLEGVVEYDLYRCEKTTAAGIIGHFFNIFRRVLFNVDIPVPAVDILTEEEKKRLLEDFNDTDRDYPAAKTVHRLFAEQVQRRPDTIAVVGRTPGGAGRCALSYGELNKRAARLAGVLRRRGVKPEVIVALVMERTLEMVTAQLAIMKAGGAYLPIDPETPTRRIISMLEDSCAPVLLMDGRFAENHPYTLLQNLRGSKKKPFLTPPQRITHLDRLPMPDRTLIDSREYSRYIGQAMVNNSIVLMATRGCPYRCIYCFKILSQQYVTRTAENIFAELELYYNLGVRRFVLIDDIFNLDIPNSSRFFNMIIEKGLDLHLFFPSGFRGDLLTEEYIDLMVEAGVISFGLALETASPRLQKILKKNLDIETLRKNIRYITEKYPRVILELFTMHGFPGETEEEAMMTLDFIKSFETLHFPYINILKIYRNTYMEKLALESGISPEAINRSEKLAFHEIPETLPFDESFTLKYQNDFLNGYFLSKERLLKVLPYQMKVLTENELIQKYDSYLPVNIRSISDLLALAGIREEELDADGFLEEEKVTVTGLNEKIKPLFPAKKPEKTALRVLLLDLTLFFGKQRDMLYDVVEPPLGLMYVMTYLNRQLGGKINGKIAKSRIDFDSFARLKQMLEEFKPHVIGIRSLTFYRDFFHKTVGLIRQWGIDVPIAAGGPYAILDYETILQDGNIDLAVLGEGETVFCKLVEEIIKNKGALPPDRVLEDIPGLAFIPRNQRQGKGFAREIFITGYLAEAASRLPAVDPEPVGAGRSSGLSYVIYTSGSTGKPRGVTVEHGNVVNVLEWFAENYRLREGEHVMQLSNYIFDPSVEQIFAALLHGATVFPAPGELMTHRESFARFVEQNRINIINFVPGVIDELLGGRKKLTSLRAVIAGGEKLEEAVKVRLLARGYNLYNQYGPTETTIDALAGKCSEKPVTLGGPIANVRCHILDANLKPVPPGVTGEIYIAGDGVARGYLNSPSLSAEKFIVDPFGRGRRKRMYRTGDLARWLPEGVVDFAGRKDHQVKIRGFRIELGEIESQLLAHDKIKNAVVMEYERNTEKYLCAYIVPRSPGFTAGLTAPALSGYLSGQLPVYMIPANFIVLESIPLTPTGKIDRRALPPPGAGMQALTRIGPRDGVEKRLVELWSDVLGIEKEEISIDANFFRLGGHSLKATILAAKIHKAFNVKVPLAEIFKTAVISGLAEYITGLAEKRFAAIKPVEKREYYGLSSAQKRLYVLQQLNPASTVYNVPGIVPLAKGPDREKLTETFKNLINRQESLRTSFGMVEEEPVQRVHEYTPFEIPGPAAAPGNDSFFGPFDLSHAPLLRVGLLENAHTGCALAVDMHHIISDGISHQLLVTDFMALYEDEMLPPLRIQYKDFSQWQNSEKETEHIKRQEDYWLEEFEGEIPALDIPTDYPRPVVQSFAGNTVNIKMDPGDTGLLKQCAQEEGVTTYMFLLAAVNILLAKLGGREDIVVGTPVVGRRHADLEKIIGMFVNTLPMRNFPEGEKIFREFLAQVKERTLEAFENQEYQFEDLVDNVAVNRDTSRNPLFDVMFALENIEVEPAGVAGESKRENHPAKFDMTLTAFETAENLYFTLNYCTKLFKEKTIRRFIAHFKKIMAGILENPGIKLSQIEIITEEEKRQVLHDFNNTESHLGHLNGKTLHRAFEAQVEKTPDHAAAAGTGSISISYGLLNEESNRLARVLRQKGVKTECIVPLVVERSIGMITGIMAILKAGGAYLPIEPGMPAPRIRFMLDNSEARHLLTQCRLIEMFKEISPAISLKDIIAVDDRAVYRGGAANLTLTAEPGNLAYVTYTSGTTGQPKGVMIEHRNVTNLIHGLNRDIYCNYDKGLHMCVLSPVIFDASVQHFFAALLLGHSLYVVPEDIRLDGAGLFRYYRKHNIEISDGTPGHLRLLLDSIDGPPPTIEVKHFVIGGEVLPRDLVEAFLGALAGGAPGITNVYGPTECTVNATVYGISRENIKHRRHVPIGKPMANYRVYIVNRAGKLQPPGIPGELCIGGSGVGRGYLKQERATLEKFVPDPFTTGGKNGETGHRMYRTGDLARWLADDSGNIEFLGRIDHQVKIRGYRIEPAEIETHLLKHPRIEAAIVVAREDEPYGKYLTAYVVVGTGAAPDGTGDLSADLVEYLALFLPGYMIPSYFVPLEKIPLNRSGKINHAALPRPEVIVSRRPGYVAPAGEREEKLAKIWSDVLGIEKDMIGVDDNFFRLGGHSLKATTAVMKVRKEFNVDMPLVDLFKNPTIKGLSRCLTDAPAGKYAPMAPVEKREYYAMSSAQRRMYVFQQLNAGDTSYNNYQVLVINSRPDIPKLTKIFAALLERHEILRTSFETIHGEPVQRVHERVEFKVEYYSPEPGKQWADDRERQIVENFLRPFRLEDVPLIRVGLLKKEEEKYLLLVDIHHRVVDAVSTDILVREFTALYNGEPLPRYRLQYKDFSQWQNWFSQSEEAKRQENYWLERFKGILPPTEFPVDFPGQEKRSRRAGWVDFRVEEKQYRRLEELALQSGATLYMVLMAVLNILVSIYTGREDTVIGLAIEGRFHPGLENVLGMFVNMLPLRNFPQPGKTFDGFLGEVRKNLLAAYENQDYQFEELVTKLKIKRELNRNPLFDIAFTMTTTDEKAGAGGPAPGDGDPATGIEAGSYDFSTARFDLTLFAHTFADGINCSFRYAADLFKKETVAGMIKQYKEILYQAVENPGIKLEEMSISNHLEKADDLSHEDEIDFSF